MREKKINEESNFYKLKEKGVNDLENFLQDHIIQSSQKTPVETPKKTYPSGKKTILLIDDDAQMIETARKIISDAGYNFLAANTGLLGLDYIVKYKPDLILLDHLMPGLSGVEVFERLKTRQRFSHLADIPVIMLTSKSENRIDRNSLFELGLSAFLIKPFGHRELLNVIDNVFIINQVWRKNKELEQKIRRSEYKYQDLIENANDIIFTLNLKGDFMIINRRLKTLTGFSRDEWLGRSFFDLVAPEDRVEARENFTKALSGKARIFEMRMISQSGTPLFLSMNINPLFEKADVVGVVGIARDITQRKELEQEIVELKNFHESIIQSVEAGLITTDLERKVTSFNLGAEMVLGYRSEEVVGKYIDDILPPDQSSKILPDGMPPDPSSLNREMEITTKDGNSVYIGFTVTPRIDNHSLRVGNIISFRDISRIKQMQMEVFRMDRLASMGVLASGMAHEIKNPIAGIKIMAQSLKEEFEMEDTHREYLTRIINQVNKLDKLLRTLLEYAKPREPEMKNYNLDSVINEVYFLIEEKVRNKQITFQKNFAENLPKIYVDFHQMQQVFINLLINAVDALPEEGLLRIDADVAFASLQQKERRGRKPLVTTRNVPYVEVKVKDNGCGIKKESLDSIFDPFFTTKPTGTGLGLSIVYQIIREHNGDVKVESQENRGTTFTILLPTNPE